MSFYGASVKSPCLSQATTPTPLLQHTLDDGVQILNVTNPSNITAAGRITDGDTLELDGAGGIAIFESGSSTYAVVAVYNDDRVQILNITDPSRIAVAGSVADGGGIMLDGADQITIFESDSHTYAAVTAAFE